MILYFISALLISFALFKLGSYATIISIISTGSKVTAAVLLLVVVLVMLYRWHRRSAHVPRLPNSAD